MDLVENIRRLKEIKKDNTQSKNASQYSGTTSERPVLGGICIKKHQIEKEEGSEQPQQIQSSKARDWQQMETNNQKREIDQRRKVGSQQKGNEDRHLGLFRGLTFCCPLYNVELTRARVKAIRATIQKNQGVLYQLEELEEVVDDEESVFCIDFMLVDAKIPRETVLACIPSRIKYRDILDFNFVFRCISQQKILDYCRFLLPERSKQLQDYMKAKLMEKTQQAERRNRLKMEFRYAAGIEPIEQHQADKTKCGANVAVETHCNTSQESKGLSYKGGECQKLESKPEKPMSFNKHIYQSFQKLSQLFQKSDRGRSLSYSRIAAVLKSVKFDICREEDADKLIGMRFIGPKTIDKIKQFIQNGSMEKLTVMEGKQENLVCQKLQKVWGIGKIKAQDLYNRGIKSVEELRQLAADDPSALTKNQKIGLKYYEDLNQRIPREKVTRMFEYIKKVLYLIVGTEVDHKIEVCGSYRRGKQTCGDMDVIITRKDGTFEPRLVNNLVDQLSKQGFLTEHLAMPRHENPKSCISYMGICKFEDEVHHRVDLKYYPVEQFAYAILYFTGSDVFNRNMRLYAMKNGFCLSDHGMWKAEKIGTNIVTHQAGIQCFTEEDIFNRLGIKYKSPAERNL